MAVAANRRRLADKLGVRGVVFLGQVHGDARWPSWTRSRGPATRTGPAPTRPSTALPGVALAVLTADCVPVLLADPRAGVVGVAHAGRVGAAAGVLPATLKAMAGLGAHVADCEALLGPAVCGACYEVPAAMRDEVEAALPGSAARTRRGTPGLDLRAGLRAQLVEAGCRPDRRGPALHRRGPRPLQLSP